MGKINEIITEDVNKYLKGINPDEKNIKTISEYIKKIPLNFLHGIIFIMSVFCYFIYVFFFFIWMFFEIIFYIIHDFLVGVYNCIGSFLPCISVKYHDIIPVGIFNNINNPINTLFYCGEHELDETLLTIIKTLGRIIIVGLIVLFIGGVIFIPSIYISRFMYNNLSYLNNEKIQKLKLEFCKNEIKNDFNVTDISMINSFDTKINNLNTNLNEILERIRIQEKIIIKINNKIKKGDKLEKIKSLEIFYLNASLVMISVIQVIIIIYNTNIIKKI